MKNINENNESLFDQVEVLDWAKGQTLMKLWSSRNDIIQRIDPVKGRKLYPSPLTLLTIIFKATFSNLTVDRKY